MSHNPGLHSVSAESQDLNIKNDYARRQGLKLKAWNAGIFKSSGLLSGYASRKLFQLRIMRQPEGDSNGRTRMSDLRISGWHGWWILPGMRRIPEKGKWSGYSLRRCSAWNTDGLVRWETMIMGLMIFPTMIMILMMTTAMKMTKNWCISHLFLIIFFKFLQF